MTNSLLEKICSTEISGVIIEVMSIIFKSVT